MKNLKSNIWFIGGDFNSKIGKKKSSTQGGHNKGCQNNNGLILEEFMQENNLFASNTAFKKQSKKKSTWVGHLRGKTVYNVIDFILVHLKLKKFLKDSNTYRGTLTQSDHNLLIVQIKKPKPYQCWTNQSKNYNEKPNFQDLITQQAYKKSIETSQATSLEEILISIKQVSNTCFKKSSKKTFEYQK